MNTREQCIQDLFDKWKNYSDRERDLIASTLLHAKVTDKRIRDVVDYIISNHEPKRRPIVNEIRQYLRAMPNESGVEYEYDYGSSKPLDPEISNALMAMCSEIISAATGQIAQQAILKYNRECEKIGLPVQEEEAKDLRNLWTQLGQSKKGLSS